MEQDISIHTARAVLAGTPRNLGRAVVISQSDSEIIDSDWREQAKCKSADPDVFFPDPENEKTTMEAKRICGGCAVRAECLQYALRKGENTGVWGGLDSSERGKARRKIVRRNRENRGMS